MDTTGRTVEVIQHVESVAKKTETPLRKIVLRKSIAKTVKKTIPHFEK